MLITSTIDKFPCFFRRHAGLTLREASNFSGQFITLLSEFVVGSGVDRGLRCGLGLTRFVIATVLGFFSLFAGSLGLGSLVFFGLLAGMISLGLGFFSFLGSSLCRSESFASIFLVMAVEFVAYVDRSVVSLTHHLVVIVDCEGASSTFSGWNAFKVFGAHGFEKMVILSGVG
jgi:hypothetical protein